MKPLSFTLKLTVTLTLACSPAQSPDELANSATAPANGAPTAASGPTDRSRVPRPPDLILIVIDTLRADHLSAYGYERPTTAHLDALAQQGALFEDVTAQSSWTLPSVASMLTGRHLFVNAQRLPSGAPSLAERLQRAGYQTAAFMGNFAVGPSGDYDRGFDDFITRKDTGGSNWDAPDLEAALNGWLDEHPLGEKPRFLYLHFLDPHWPYDPAEEVLLAGQPRISADTEQAWLAALPDEGPLRETFARDRKSILADIDAYDREIAATDAAIGRLLPRLRERPNMVIVAADHGECLWQRRHHPRLVAQDLKRQGRAPESATLRDIFFRDHSYHMFQELLFTPLIACGPELKGGLRIDNPVENVDIVPTLLRAAGIPAADDLDGLALQDVVHLGASRPVIYSHSHEATVVRQVQSARKLIWPTDTGFFFQMPIMLFHLDSDPHERHNMVSEDLDGFRQLVRLRETAATAFHLFDDEATRVDDEQHLADLRALGYVGPGFSDDPRGDVSATDDDGSR